MMKVVSTFFIGKSLATGTYYPLQLCVNFASLREIS